MHVEGFLEALTTANQDGRVILSRQGNWEEPVHLQLVFIPRWVRTWKRLPVTHACGRGGEEEDAEVLGCWPASARLPEKPRGPV